VKLADADVYVIHAPELVERRAQLGAALDANGLAATWIDDPVAGSLDDELVRRYYRASHTLWSRRSRSTRPIPFRQLSDREIAVTIAHAQTLARIGRSPMDWAIVFEDDAVLAPGFADEFDDWFADLPADADVVYLGSCCGLRIADSVSGEHFYRKEHPATKCSDSTLYSRSAAAALARELVPFSLTIDWELNHHLRRLDLAVYWLEPPLVTQGSETGIYSSSQR
jgi:GR25 family glycosyltransferase involved in LPS biosynthesis